MLPNPAFPSCDTMDLARLRLEELAGEAAKLKALSERIMRIQMSAGKGVSENEIKLHEPVDKGAIRVFHLVLLSAGEI